MKWIAIIVGFRKLVSLRVFQRLLLLPVMFAESTQGSIIGIINNNELTSHDTAALTRLTKSIITTSDLLGQVKLAEDL